MPCSVGLLKIQGLSAKDKHSAIAASKSCQNCLRFHHKSDQCSSQSGCKTCQGKHHTFLHEAFNATPGTHACSLTQKSCQMTIFPTARVQVIGRNKQLHNLRALLDTGAHINAVTAKACKTRGLQPKPSIERIIGVNQKDSMPDDGSLKLRNYSQNRGKYYTQLRSAEDSYSQRQSKSAPLRD